ncbi:response regulator [candidate division KSB1 bacterium]|nr:response regulator [candidate division KSB1 bacterium]
MAKIRLLIIDDEPLVRNFLKEALLTKSSLILMAENGQEAYKLLAKEKFDLVLADLRLPDINGLEVLKKIKEIQNGPEVIVISGYATF